MCKILGDLNIYDTVNNPGKKPLNLVRSNTFHSLISMATRISHSSAPTIGHILLNEAHFKMYPAVLHCSISEHYAVLCAISKLTPISSKTIFHNYFDLKRFDLEKFWNELQASLETKFVYVLAKEEIEITSEFSLFTSTVSEIISRNAPKKI